MLASCGHAIGDAPGQHVARAVVGSRRTCHGESGTLFSFFSVAHSLGAFQHKDSDVNNANTLFEFTPENYEAIERILAKYPKESALSAVIPLLDLAQRQNNNWCVGLVVGIAVARLTLSLLLCAGFRWRR